VKVIDGNTERDRERKRKRESEREREREIESMKMVFELLLSNNTFYLFYRSYKKCDGWSVKNVLFIKIYNY
jgi:hypothetical protein